MASKTVGILGSTGFLGSFVCEKFESEGWNVVGGSRRTGVDATILTSVIEWIRGNKIDYIINLAAFCGGIGLNQKQPADLWSETTKIISTTLEAAVECGIKKFVQLGTVCSYSADTPVPFKETDLMRYGDPEVTNSAYGLAKLSGLFGCRAYRQQYGLDAIFLQPVNLYGLKDNFDLETSHVIPAIIRKCVDAQRNNLSYIEIWGDGLASREFLYVVDCAEAIFLATEYYSKPDPVNLGSGIEITIANLVTTIAKLTNFTGKIKWDITKPNGQMRRCLSTIKAKEEFGFVAKTGLIEGLKRTIEYYKSI